MENLIQDTVVLTSIKVRTLKLYNEVMRINDSMNGIIISNKEEEKDLSAKEYSFNLRIS